jgi:hypothetical protein
MKILSLLKLKYDYSAKICVKMQYINVAAVCTSGNHTSNIFTKLYNYVYITVIFFLVQIWVTLTYYYVNIIFSDIQY